PLKAVDDITGEQSNERHGQQHGPKRKSFKGQNFKSAAQNPTRQWSSAAESKEKRKVKTNQKRTQSRFRRALINDVWHGKCNSPKRNEPVMQPPLELEKVIGAAQMGNRSLVDGRLQQRKKIRQQDNQHPQARCAHEHSSSSERHSKRTVGIRFTVVLNCQPHSRENEEGQSEQKRRVMRGCRST